MRASRSGASLFALVAALLLSVAPARADRAAQARALIDVGTRKFQAGEYDKAIEMLQEAYDLSPLPQLLFNIATAHRKAQRPREALAFYEKFLASDARGGLRAEAERNAVEMRAAVAELAQREADARAKDEAARAARAAEPAATVPATAPAPVIPATPAPTVTPNPAVVTAPAPAKKRSRAGLAAGMGVALVVVAGAAVGVGLGVGLQPKDPETQLGTVSLHFPP